MAIHSSEDFIYHLGNKLKEYQNSDGSIICKDDQTHDHWDHLEACIGLGIAGFKDEFERGLAWSRLNQNSDGSWYEEYKKSNPTKLNKQSNHAAYFATALAFHYILFQDKAFIKENWSCLLMANDFLLDMQSKSGAFIWNIDEDGEYDIDFLLTGNSSIVKSLECSIFLADEMGEFSHKDKWHEIYQSAKKCVQAPKNNFDLKADRSNFSMDAYYPILSGALSAEQEAMYVEKTMQRFYVDGLGVKCVSEEPWVTVAETCEFCIALVKAGHRERAIKILQEVKTISDDEQIPYMGWQFNEKIFWPFEQPSWTIAALILAEDAIYNTSKASRVFTANLV